MGSSKIFVDLAGEQSKTYLKQLQLNFHLDLDVTSYRFPIRFSGFVNWQGSALSNYITRMEIDGKFAIVMVVDQTYKCDLIFCTLFLFRTRR